MPEKLFKLSICNFSKSPTHHTTNATFSSRLNLTDRSPYQDAAPVTGLGLFWELLFYK